MCFAFNVDFIIISCSREFSLFAANDFFSTATGITKDSVSRLTIFSIVQADKLSNMFEMVAEALRGDRTRQASSEPKSADSSANTTSESGADSSVNPQWEQYTAITLPCISFPNRSKPGSPHHPHPLYMTVTLLSDDDPRKRCFHCILTDNPGTNGKMGFITPELLAMLFSGRPDTVGGGGGSSDTNVSSLGSDSDNVKTPSKNSSSVSAEDSADMEEETKTPVNV